MCGIVGGHARENPKATGRLRRAQGQNPDVSLLEPVCIESTQHNNAQSNPVTWQ